MKNDHKQPTLAFASIGIDISKESFTSSASPRPARWRLSEKFKHLVPETELAKLPPSIVGFEACLSAHFVSRTLRRLGHSPLRGDKFVGKLRQDGEQRLPQALGR